MKYKMIDTPDGWRFVKGFSLCGGGLIKVTFSTGGSIMAHLSEIESWEITND